MRSDLNGLRKEFCVTPSSEQTSCPPSSGKWGVGESRSRCYRDRKLGAAPKGVVGGGVVEQPLPPFPQQDKVNAGTCISAESGLRP